MARSKCKTSEQTSQEGSHVLHKRHKRKQKVSTENSIPNSDSCASKSEGDPSVKFGETGEQVEDVSCLGVSVSSGKKKKGHRKKKIGDDGKGGNEHAQNASSLPIKKLKKTRKHETENTTNVEWSTKKSVSTGNGDANAKRTTLEPETTDVAVERKRGKKLKRLRGESAHHETDKPTAETEPDTDSVRKKKRSKRDAVKCETSTAADAEHTDSSAASTPQYHALEYLRTWKSTHDSWTFQKVRQVWLLQHMYDSTKVTTWHSLVCSL